MHLSTHTWMRPEPLEATLRRASQLGYESIELAGEPDRYSIAETQRLLKKYSMFCWGTVTVMYGMRDLIADDPGQRADTIEYINKVVSMASALGGKICTVVPSTVGKLTPSSSAENEWKWAVEGLREVCAFAKDQDIKIAIEPLNRFETYFINRSDQALALAREVGWEGCGIAFDSFHLSIEEKDMYSAIRACGSRIFDVHLGENNRLSPGDGSIDWPRFISTLRQVGYSGGLAHESMPPIDRTPASPYRDLGGQLETDPVDVDEGTLQFLKDHASGVLADKYYSSMVAKTAETILPLFKSS